MARGSPHIQDQTVTGDERLLRFFRHGEVAEIVALQEPYRLLDVPGIGWKKADEIALKLGVTPDSPERIEAAVVQALKEAMGDGHSALPREDLLSCVRSDRLLGRSIGRKKIEAALAECDEACRIIEESGLYFLPPRALRAEWRIAEAAADLLRSSRPFTPEDRAVAEPIISGSKLVEVQRAAVWMALEQGLSILTGRPGSGKSTTAGVFAGCCKVLGWKGTVAAPTGKAAARAKEVMGLEAGTVHRLVGGPPGSLRATPIPADVIIVDEVSMLDAETCAWLLSNVSPGTRVLLVGDENQLPSIGHGTVLGDLISSGCIPAVHLKEPQRQRKDSRIVKNANHLLDGEPLLLKKDDEWLFADVTTAGAPPEARAAIEQQAARKRLLGSIRWIVQQKCAYPARDIQVLSPMRNGLLGVDALNELLQGVLNPDGERGPVIGSGVQVRVGDRVIQTRNDYQAAEDGLMNGEQGVVAAVSIQANAIWVDFGDRMLMLRDSQLSKLELAWAITVHRSQGSEWPYTVLIYHSKAHEWMLDRSLLYTAITRAKKCFILIGDRAALNQTWQRLKRHTGLAQLLSANN